MRYIVNNSDTLRQQGYSKKQAKKYEDTTIVNYHINGYDDDYLIYDVEPNYYLSNKINYAINEKNLRNRNFNNYKRSEDLFLNDITSQIYDETYRIINNLSKEPVIKDTRVNPSYLTNDPHTNKIIEIVASDDKKYLDLISRINEEYQSKPTNLNSTDNRKIMGDNENGSIVNEQIHAEPFIKEVKKEDVIVNTQDQVSQVSKDSSTSINEPKQKLYDDLNKILPNEYERLRKEIKDYEKNYFNTLLISDTTPLSVSDAVDVNLYKKWYLSNDEMFEARRLQDKKLDNLIVEYEKILRKRKIDDAQREIEQFKDKLDSEIKVVNEKNKELSNQLNEINESNSKIKNENKDLKGEIKNLEHQLKTNFEKQRSADAVRKALVEKLFNKNNNQLNINSNVSSGVSLSQVKQNAIELSNYYNNLSNNQQNQHVANNLVNASNSNNSNHEHELTNNELHGIYENNNISNSINNEIIQEEKNIDSTANQNVYQNNLTVNKNQLNTPSKLNNFVNNEIQSKINSVDNSQNNFNSNQIFTNNEKIASLSDAVNRRELNYKNSNDLDYTISNTSVKNKISSINLNQDKFNVNKQMNQNSFENQLNNNVTTTQPVVSNRQKVLQGFNFENNNQQVSLYEAAAQNKRNSLFQSFNSANPNSASMTVNVHTKTINISNRDGEQPMSLSDALKFKKQ